METLEAERDRFEAVLQSMDDAVIAIDPERTIVAVNRAARTLLGIASDASGSPLHDVVHLPGLPDAVDAALRGEPRSVDVKLDASGVGRHLLVRVTPQGDSSGAVVVIHDVTEVRRLETVRRDFVANVSHELRTPVSIIRANAETLLSGAMDEPEHARRFLDAVHRNAERLGQLISDLLDISRIEAGNYTLDISSVSLASVVRSVQKAVSESCRRRGVTLKVLVDPELKIWADAGALEQVLINLVENAVTYGPRGGWVELAADVQDSTVRIEVRDVGPGIEAAHRPRVFERFYRVDRGRSRGMGGTGLGLAIVKHLTEAMRGEVGVEPREPTGCIFWVRLARALAVVLFVAGLAQTAACKRVTTVTPEHPIEITAKLPPQPRPELPAVPQPPPPPRVTVAGDLVELDEPLGFDEQGKLSAEHQDILAALGKWLVAKPEVLVLTVEVHSIGEGSKRTHKKLSKALATQIVDALIAQGVAAERVVAASVGKSDDGLHHVALRITQRAEPAVGP